MGDISDIRDALATRLATISGLRTVDVIKDNFNPPVAVVGPPDPIEFDSTMARGSDDMTFKVILIVSRTSERAAQDKLDQYLEGSGTTSVKAAIEADTSLGGTVHTCRVARAENYGQLVVAGVECFGVIFVVEVVTRGTS